MIKKLMIRRVVTLWAPGVCLLLLCCTRPAFPFQNGGAILGRILEAEGTSPAPRATVVARNQTTGYQNSVFSAPDGTFLLTLLPPGVYTVTAKSEGFQQGSIPGYPVGLSGSPPALPAEIRLARSSAQRALSDSNAQPPQTARLQPNQVKSEIVVESRVRWNADLGRNGSNLPAAQSAGGDVFSQIESRQTRGPLPRQRMPELSKDQIMVVILDEQGEQKDWLLLPDPRIMRSEGPGANGELTGEVFYLSSAEFLVPIYGDLLPATIRIYKPYWTGDLFSFDLLGTLTLR